MNNKIIFSFVLLHYYTIDDTRKCINSIQDKCKKYNYYIVVVDNASPNGTGLELKNEYKGNKRVHVIINSHNLGFANGNNVGFKFAKKQLNSNFIILCNNDTYLIQDNFLDLICKEYRKSKFAVLGPKILLLNNEINPVQIELPSLSEMKKQLRSLRLTYYTSLFFINPLYVRTKSMIKKIIKKDNSKYEIRKNKNRESVNKRLLNVVLHGSFLIFSKEYISIFDGLDNRTFLYREEELLFLRLKNNNLLNVYNPELEIFHSEDGATNAVSKTSRKRRLFKSRNCIKSTKIIINDMKKNK